MLPQVMTNPAAYEVINPDDFGVQRKIQLAHRLTVRDEPLPNLARWRYGLDWSASAPRRMPCCIVWACAVVSAHTP
jgi:hypothetical protein